MKIIGPSSLRVNSLLVWLRFMDGDQLATWVAERAGNFNRAEAEALELHLKDLLPWQQRRAS